MSHHSTPAGRRRASITQFLLAQQSSPQPDDDAVEVIHAADLEAAGYMLGEQLGEGRFSKVHLGTHVASGAEHAVKVVESGSHGKLEIQDNQKIFLKRKDFIFLKIVTHSTGILFLGM